MQGGHIRPPQPWAYTNYSALTGGGPVARQWSVTSMVAMFAKELDQLLKRPQKQKFTLFISKLTQTFLIFSLHQSFLLSFK